jgi:hypothetical protein
MVAPANTSDIRKARYAILWYDISNFHGKSSIFENMYYHTEESNIGIVCLTIKEVGIA